MDQYEDAYRRIGLSPEKLLELAALARLAESSTRPAATVVIETVIVSLNSRETIRREIANAKLV